MKYRYYMCTAVMQKPKSE